MTLRIGSREFECCPGLRAGSQSNSVPSGQIHPHQARPKQDCADHGDQAEQGDGQPLMTGQPEGQHGVWIEPEWQSGKGLSQSPLFKRQEDAEKGDEG